MKVWNGQNKDLKLKSYCELMTNSSYEGGNDAGAGLIDVPVSLGPIKSKTNANQADFSLLAAYSIEACFNWTSHRCPNELKLGHSSIEWSN